MMAFLHKTVVAASLATALTMLGGCASPGPASKTAPTTLNQQRALDPWEAWNRRVFAFNEGLDEQVLKPVATGYAKVVPRFVRQGVDNVFANVADAWSAVNNVLQGKAEPAFVDLVRFTTNSTFGIFGLLDIASEAGLARHGEDFGQTLGVWGAGAGAYVVWPLLGPSTVRDSAALALDLSVSPALAVDSSAGKLGISALQVVNTRARLLGASSVIDAISLDKYTFVRDAYLQRRRSLVYDGNPPPSQEPDPRSPSRAAP